MEECKSVCSVQRAMRYDIEECIVNDIEKKKKKTFIKLLYSLIPYPTWICTQHKAYCMEDETFFRRKKKVLKA